MSNTNPSADLRDQIDGVFIKMLTIPQTGGQLYMHNPQQLREATQNILNLITTTQAKAVAEAERLVSQKVSDLQNSIAKYGDGETVYFNGEAVVPISKVLKVASELRQKAENE